MWCRMEVADFCFFSYSTSFLILPPLKTTGFSLSFPIWWIALFHPSSLQVYSWGSGNYGRLGLGSSAAVGWAFESKQLRCNWLADLNKNTQFLALDDYIGFTILVLLYWFSAQDSVKPQLVSGVLNGQTLSLLQGAVVVVAQVHLLRSRIKHVCVCVWTWGIHVYTLTLQITIEFNIENAWELQVPYVAEISALVLQGYEIAAIACSWCPPDSTGADWPFFLYFLVRLVRHTSQFQCPPVSVEWQFLENGSVAPSYYWEPPYTRRWISKRNAFIVNCQRV